MVAYAELIKHLQDIRTIDDVIAGMISKLKSERLPADPLKIHKAFKELKAEFPEMLTELEFFRGNTHDFSEQLEQTLFRLEMAGILETLNPAYQYYTIDASIKERLAKRVLPRFKHDEQKILQKMAERFEIIMAGEP